MKLFDFEDEKQKEYDAVGFENQRKSVTRLPQVGTSNLKRDVVRKALAPGKRVSKSGKIYWETRKNRSDVPGKKI